MYQDVAGDTMLGHHILCNVLAGYIVGRIARRLVLEHPIVKVGLVMSASLLQGMLFIGIQYVQTPGISAVKEVLTVAVPTAFYSGLITPFIFFLLRRSFHSRAVVSGGA
jgi:rod shape-determining protein MreD